MNADQIVSNHWHKELTVTKVRNDELGSCHNETMKKSRTYRSSVEGFWGLAGRGRIDYWFPESNLALWQETVLLFLTRLPSRTQLASLSVAPLEADQRQKGLENDVALLVKAGWFWGQLGMKLLGPCSSDLWDCPRALSRRKDGVEEEKSYVWEVNHLLHDSIKHEGQVELGPRTGNGLAWKQS